MSSHALSHEVALVQLRAICETCRSFHGPQRCWKAVVDPKTLETSLTADPIDVLRVACASTRVGDLLYRACVDHRRSCGCGTASLLALVRELSAHVSALFRTYQLAPHRVARASRLASAAAARTLFDLANPCENLLRDRDALAALERDAGESLVNTAAERVACRLAAHATGRWDTGAVLLHRIKTGHARDARVFSGLLLPTTRRALRAWRERGGPQGTSRVALLRNSFSLRAAELGSRQAARLDPLQVHRAGVIDESADAASRRREVLDALTEAGVGLLVCTGAADEAWAMEGGSRLLVLANAHMREMESLERMFGTYMFSDLEQLLASTGTVRPRPARIEGLDPRAWGDLGAPDGPHAFFHVSPEDDCDADLDAGPRHATNGEMVPVCVLLASPVEALLQDMETRFWTSLHRLQNTLQTGVIPGAGGAERHVAQALRAHAESAQDPVLALVLCTWADAFRDVAAALVSAETVSGASVETVSVLDDAASKTAAVDAAARVLHRLLYSC